MKLTGYISGRRGLLFLTIILLSTCVLWGGIVTAADIKSGHIGLNGAASDFQIFASKSIELKNKMYKGTYCTLREDNGDVTVESWGAGLFGIEALGGKSISQLLDEDLDRINRAQEEVLTNPESLSKNLELLNTVELDINTHLEKYTGLQKGLIMILGGIFAVIMLFVFNKTMKKRMGTSRG